MLNWKSWTNLPVSSAAYGVSAMKPNTKKATNPPDASHARARRSAERSSSTWATITGASRATAVYLVDAARPAARPAATNHRGLWRSTCRRSASDAIAKNVISESVIAKCDSRTCRMETARNSAAISPTSSPPTRRPIRYSTPIVAVPRARRSHVQYSRRCARVSAARPGERLRSAERHAKEPGEYVEGQRTASERSADLDRRRGSRWRGRATSLRPAAQSCTAGRTRSARTGAARPLRGRSR